MEAAKDSDIEDLIAAVAEGGSVDDDHVPNAVVALALVTMDQIEDDEEGIVAAVDDRFVKFTAVDSPFVFEDVKFSHLGQYDM